MWAISILFIAEIAATPFSVPLAGTSSQTITTTRGAGVDLPVEAPRLAFASASLERLHERLSLRQATLVQDTLRDEPDSLRVRLLNTTYRGKSLLVKVVQEADHLVTHIGFDFFNRDEVALLDPIGHFLEKQLLDYYTLDVSERIASMQADRVTLELNGVIYGRLGFTDFEIVDQVIQNRTTLQLSSDVFRYHFTCADSVGNELAVTIPARLDLIAGKDKKELDDALERALRALASSGSDSVGYEAPDLSRLRLYADTLYLYQSGVLHPGLHADLFYERRDTALVLLRDEHYPLESLNNLLLRPTRHDSVTLQIVHVGYGWEKKEYAVDLGRLIRYFMEKHDLYLGFEDIALDTARVTLVFTHRRYRHLHLMTMDWPAATFPPRMPRVVSARLYSHIRRDNARALFSMHKWPDAWNVPRPDRD